MATSVRDFVFEFGEWIIAEARGAALLRTCWTGRLFSAFRRRFVFLGRRHGSIGQLARIFSALVARQRTEHEDNAFADQLRVSIGMAVRSDLFDKFLDLLKAELLVRHFTSTEAERHLDFHFLAEEIDGVAELDAKIMRIN